MLFLLPSKKQWRLWSLPSKLTEIGSYVGITGLIVSFFGVYLNMASAKNVTNVTVETFKGFPAIAKTIEEFAPNGWHLQYAIPVDGKYHVLVVQRDEVDFDSDQNRFLLLLENEGKLFKVVVATPNVLEDPAGFGRYGDTLVGIYTPIFSSEFDVVFYSGGNWNAGFEFTFEIPFKYEHNKEDGLYAVYEDCILKKGIGFRTIDLDSGTQGKLSEIFYIKPGIPLSKFNWGGNWVEIDKRVIPSSEGFDDLKYLGDMLE